MKRHYALCFLLILITGLSLPFASAKPPWQKNQRDFEVTISGDFKMVNPMILTQSADSTYWTIDGYQGENMVFEISYVGYAEFNQPAALQNFYQGERIDIYSLGHAVDNLTGVGPRDTWIFLMTWEHGGENYYMTISSDWDSDLPGEGEGSYDSGSDSWTINYKSDNTEIMQIKKEEIYLDHVCRGKSGNCVFVERTRTIDVWDGLTDDYLNFLNINLVVQRLLPN